MQFRELARLAWRRGVRLHVALVDPTPRTPQEEFEAVYGKLPEQS
jgi:hypothetical protein